MAKDKTKTKVVKTKEDVANKTVAELKADLTIAQKSLHEGTLTNPHAIKAIKKAIARKMTLENAAKVAEDKEPKIAAKDTKEKGVK